MLVSSVSGPWQNWPEMASRWVKSLFFLLVRTLQTFWAERIFILRFLGGFQIPGFPDSQIQGCQLACLVANWPEEPSGPENADFLLFNIDV